MQPYFSTFISGFQTVVEALLHKEVSDVKIEHLYDGLIVYKTSAPMTQLKSLRFFNNTFLLLNASPTGEEEGNASIAKRLIADVDIYATAFPLLSNYSRSFRIFISKENELVSINNEIIQKMESNISRQIKWTVNRGKADYEFWFISRSEGYAYLGIRLTMGDGEKEEKTKGRLKRELAYFLNILATPQKNDVVFDPFAGSGSIPFERAKSLPYKKIIIGENDNKLLPSLVQGANHFKSIEVKKLNALHMPEVADHSVDVIVTDPPWGVFNMPHENFVYFYSEMLEELSRVLTERGRMVILTAKKEEFEQSLKTIPNLTLEQTYDILVSGKKARVYIIHKKITSE